MMDIISRFPYEYSDFLNKLQATFNKCKKE